MATSLDIEELKKDVIKLVASTSDPAKLENILRLYEGKSLLYV